MTTEMLPASTQTTDQKRAVALLKAIGFDRLAPEQREIALNIAARYDLDPLLKHIVLIDGKPYITRDGLLHIAHRSGVFDGIEVTPPVKVDRFWRVTATVYRKDMSHPIIYPGRYPVGAKNDEEMAIKVGESMALRRAFDVAAPTVDERWASDEVEVPDQAPKAQTLAELARARREAVLPDQAEQHEPEAEPVTAATDSPSAVPPEEDFSTLPGFEA